MAEPQTKGEELHRIYFDAHQRRVQEALERARIEFAEAGLAEGVYAQYVAQLLETQMVQLSNIQKALLDYDESAARAESERGKSKEKKAKLTGEENAKLLAVAVDAGNVLADSTSEAAERLQKVKGIVNKDYENTAAQSNVMNAAVSKVNETIALASATNTADLAKTVTDSINANIAPGTFSPGSSQAKSAAAALMSSVSSALSNSALYNSSPANKADVDNRVRAGIASALGVTANYTDSVAVEADKAIDIADQNRSAGAQGGSIAGRAGQLAIDLVNENRQPAQQTAAETAAAAETSTLKGEATLFDKDFGETYLRYLKLTGSSEDAKEKAIQDYLRRTPVAPVPLKDEDGNNVKDSNGDDVNDPQGTEAARKEQYVMVEELFNTSFKSKVDYLTNSPTLERKWYDPVYIDMYVRSKNLTDDVSASGKKLGGALEDIKDIPTEEMKRRRGAEIYEPLAPGAARKGSEAATLEYDKRQKAGTMIKGEKPGDLDDFLAERIVKREMPMDETQKIVTGAAVRAARLGPMTEADKKGGMLASRLYNNVATGQLKGKTPADIVRHAADLVNGDVTKRDELLTYFYRIKRDKQLSLESYESNERLAEVKKAEEPPKKSAKELAKIEAERLRKKKADDEAEAAAALKEKNRKARNQFAEPDYDASLEGGMPEDYDNYTGAEQE